MRLYLLIWGMSLGLGLVALPSPVRAQSTQPASAPSSAPSSVSVPTSAPADAERSDWRQTVERVADALSSQDGRAVRASLGRDAQVRNFASDAASTVERAVATVAQAKLLGTHAYAQVPSTLASDLANDFQNAGDVVPEQVCKDMQPADERAEKRANDTAAAWIAQVLQPKKDQSVGIMVFWPTNRRAPTDTSARRAIFVLVKGQSINGVYVVQQLTFGDPLETPR
jgi:hypothetical protein